MNKTEETIVDNNYTSEQIPGTPFRINGDDETGYFISMGDYKLSETYSKEKCEDMINSKNWELLMTVITSALHMMHNNEQMKAFMNNNNNNQKQQQ